MVQSGSTLDGQLVQVDRELIDSSGSDQLNMMNDRFQQEAFVVLPPNRET